MPEWTLEAVRIAAGLKPWESYRTNTVRDVHIRDRRKWQTEQSWLADINRQTGASTQVVCQAIAHALNKRRSLIIVYNTIQIDLLKQKIVEIAEDGDLKFDANLIRFVAPGEVCDILIDHSGFPIT